MSGQSEISPGYGGLIGQVLAGRVGLQQVWFKAGVLDKYLATDVYDVLRTDSAGRLRRGRAWALDFGIVEGPAGEPDLLHLSAQDLAGRLPVAESEHWLDHAVGLPTSSNFLMMQLHPEACIDDGEIRRWDRE